MWSNCQSGGLAVNRMALTVCQDIRNLCIYMYYIIIQNYIQTFIKHTKLHATIVSTIILLINLTQLHANHCALKKNNKKSIPGK